MRQRGRQRLKARQKEWDRRRGSRKKGREIA